MIHPYLNDLREIHPHEQIDNSTTQNFAKVYLNTISPTELREMEAKLSHRCRERFKQTKDNYDQTLLNIDDTLMQLNEKIETQD